MLKLLGCTVIGCASTPEKIQLLESIGVHAFNYKMEKPLDALLRLAPNGLDIYFDNPKPDSLHVFDIIDTRVKIGWKNMNSSECRVLKYYVRFREVGSPNWITRSAGAGSGLCNYGLNNTEKHNKD